VLFDWELYEAMKENYVGINAALKEESIYWE
jgi:hypothetical protein